MKKQVSLKASIRQPIRTLIFVLLVAVATFGFVARVVEFSILNNEINRLAGFYRTIGTLVPIDPAQHNNVYEAAGLISGSPFVVSEDRRVLVQGVMDGIPNATIDFRTIGGNSLQRGENPFSYKDLYPYESFMVVEVIHSFRRTVFMGDINDLFITHSIALNIIETLHGYNQFTAGTRQVNAEFTVDENGNSIADVLQVGGRYLIRGTNQNAFDNRAAVDIFPIVGDLYFVSMDDEVMLAYVLETLASELAIIDANTNMLMLTGTRDMTALPFVQTGAYERFQGRLLTYDDYVNANPVIVLPQVMDSRRVAARVGQTITVTLRDMRTFVDGSPAPVWGLSPEMEGLWRNIPAGYWTAIPRSYEGDWQNYPTITLELEVVGTYQVPDNWFLPRWSHIQGSFRNWEAFIPTSLIPEGWGIVDAHLVSGAYNFILRSADDIDAFEATFSDRLEALGFEVAFHGPDARNFYTSITPIRNSILLNLILFSAVLVVVLALTIFLYLKQRFKEFAIMRALGITQGSAIWQVITPVLLFWLPIVIISGIGAWYFALEQASAGLQTLMEIDTPTDYGEVFMRMNILARARWEAEQAVIFTTPELSIMYLAALCAGLLVAWVVAALLGVVSFAQQSMLSLIQRSQGAGATIKAAKESAPPTEFNIMDVGLLLAKRTTQNAFGRAKAARRHHLRHIKRSPIKTMLVVGVALLFIVAMGWLNVTIHFTEGEIDRLYLTTPVYGEVIDPRGEFHGVQFGHAIPVQSLNLIRDSEFVESYYYTRRHLWSHILIPMDLGELENQFADSATVGGVFPESDMVIEISSWEGFVREASRPMAFGAMPEDDFEYTFAPGFDASDFVIGDDFIPVIVHEHFLQRYLQFNEAGVFAWDFSVEEPLFVALNLELGGSVRLANSDYYNDYRKAVVIGYYSGAHPDALQMWSSAAVLIPSSTPRVVEVAAIDFSLDTIQPSLWGIATENPEWFVSTLSFSINPTKTRYLTYFEAEVAERLIFRQWYEVAHFLGNLRTEIHYIHQLELDVAELVLVVMPLESNLSLMRILYPMVIALSFVLSLGLCLLIALQNAKNAALMRVLGLPKFKTRLNLFMELVAVCFIGLLVGLAAVLVMGVALPEALLLAGVYLTGAVIGAIIGVIIISSKTPLDLLQVRE